MPAARPATKNGPKATVTRRAHSWTPPAKVLAEGGYAGTRLGEIAEVAGIQPPAIYYHFESRKRWWRRSSGSAPARPGSTSNGFWPSCRQS